MAEESTELLRLPKTLKTVYLINP